MTCVSLLEIDGTCQDISATDPLTGIHGLSRLPPDFHREILPLLQVALKSYPLLLTQILHLRPGLTELSIMASMVRKVTETVDNLEATARFLYTILKQRDLKDIDWDKVACELGITNGHAARMRYTRVKQKMEGSKPVPRNPTPKRASRIKRAKEKDTPVIKSKGSPGLADQMQASSLPVASFDAGQESLLPTSETVINSKPREDRLSPSSLPEIPVAIPAGGYGCPEMQLQMMTPPNQVQQHGRIHQSTPSHEHTQEFSIQPQNQLQLYLYQMMPQGYGVEGQTLRCEMMLGRQWNYDNCASMDLYTQTPNGYDGLMDQIKLEN